MRFRVVAAILVLVALTACHEAPARSDASPTQPSGERLQTSSSTDEGSSSRGAATPLGSRSIVTASAPQRCVHADVPAGAMTRYSAPLDSRFRVAVGVLENACASGIILSELAIEGPEGPALKVDGFWVSPIGDGPIDGISSQPSNLPWVQFPLVVQAQSTVVIYAAVRVGPGTQPQGVQPIKAAWFEPAGPNSAKFSSATRICTCPMPSS